MTWSCQILSNSVRGAAIVLAPDWLGFRRFGIAPSRVAAALVDARGFAGAAAQVVELGPPHRTAPHHLDRGDARRVERKDALDPFAVGDLAQGEVRVDPGVLAGDANAFEGLDALALALDDADADAHRIARLERRDRPRRGELGGLLGLELLQKIHHVTSCVRPFVWLRAAPTDRAGARGSAARRRRGASRGCAGGRPTPGSRARSGPASIAAGCSGDIRGDRRQSSPR